MSIQMRVVLFVVLFGLAYSAKPKSAANTAQCVDNTLYAKYICVERADGERFSVPGKCSQYYECSKGVSKVKTCSKFFDPKTKKCVSQSSCVEVDNTDCVIPTPPPCHQTPPTCPPLTVCPPATECPVCPPPTECPAPKPPCPSPPTEGPGTPETPPSKPSCPSPPTEGPGTPETPPSKPSCPSPPTEGPGTPETPRPKPPCSPSGGPCDPPFDPNDLYGSFVCRNKLDGTMLSTREGCRDYYYCIRGYAYRKSCGKNQYFDPAIGACDEKKSVLCPLDKKFIQ